MLHRAQKVDYLKRVPLFAHLSQKELQSVAALTTELPLREGKALTREGARGHEFFVLTAGTARVQRDDKTVNTLEAGDFFGEIALVSDRPRTATVTATSSGRVLVLSEREFRTLMREFPSIQLKVLKALADRLASYEQH